MDLIISQNNYTNPSERLNLKPWSQVCKSPLIDELVDAIDTEQINKIIDKYIEIDCEKSIFLMFVMMTFVCQIQLHKHTINDKKEFIKYMLTDIFRDHNKRKLCLELFEKNFRPLFQENNVICNENIIKKIKL